MKLERIEVSSAVKPREGEPLVARLVEQLGIPGEKTQSYIEGLYAALGSENQPQRMIAYLTFKVEQKESE